VVAFSVDAQINMSDSTAQVIGYWNKFEKQTYSVIQSHYKIKGTDTTSREKTTYEVEITVKDSTEKSYLIEWFYKNYHIDTKDEIKNKIASLYKDVKVLIRTSELGVIEEVVNWKEVRDYLKVGMDAFRKEYKQIPNMDKMITQIETMFSSKESIEATAINDAQQFYTFHGAKYKLGELLEARIKVPNMLGDDPFDSDFSVSLDEINSDDNNFIMRSTQVIDSKQLTDATFEYLNKMSSTLNMPAPKRTDLMNLKNETHIASRIHGSGWVVYSVFTKTVNSDTNTNVEERIIEIK
jgi:hypothetical protein